MTERFDPVAQDDPVLAVREFQVELEKLLVAHGLRLYRGPNIEIMSLTNEPSLDGVFARRVVAMKVNIECDVNHRGPWERK